MIRGTQHSSMDDDIRSIARSLARELKGPSPYLHMSLNALFRLRNQWKAHGFYGMGDSMPARTLCLAAFGPHDEHADDSAFVRSARATADIVLKDSAPATAQDLDVFWTTVERFGKACGVDMPERPAVDSGAEDPDDRGKDSPSMDVKAANHAELRMALIFRADLDAMTRGKSEGQACHAGFEAGVLLARADPDLADRYLADGQPKIVLETPDIDGLHKAVAKAHKRGVRVLCITDLGRTCFDGPTMTCALIGPMSKTDSNAITRGTELRDPPPPEAEEA